MALRIAPFTKNDITTLNKIIGIYFQYMLKFWIQFSLTSQPEIHIHIELFKNLFLKNTGFRTVDPLFI